MNAICIKKLYEEHGFPNACRCPHCQQEKDGQAALDYYRQNHDSGPTHHEPFPEKEPPDAM